MGAASSATRSSSTAASCASWSTQRVDDRVARFYRERFDLTLAPLLELDFDPRPRDPRAAAVEGGREAPLARSLRVKPWYNRG